MIIPTTVSVATLVGVFAIYVRNRQRRAQDFDRQIQARLDQVCSRC